MKKIILFGTLVFLGLGSCSDSEGTFDNSDAVFLPLTLGSSWSYDVSLDETPIGIDVLFVSEETTLNGETYQQLKTEELPNGFYTSILNNNTIRKFGDKLLITGSTGLATADFLSINIEVNDFILFKENSSNNAKLDEISGTITEDLQGLPLKIDYNLKSIFKESLSSFSVPGKETYSNVKVMQLVTNLKITTEYLVPVLNTIIDLAVLNAQDVFISTQYYAEGVGMIYSKTDVNYQLNNFAAVGVDLPIPQEGSSVIEEYMN
jgi:hypothetical protein